MAEAHGEPIQTTKKEPFVEIVHNFNYFHKKASP